MNPAMTTQVRKSWNEPSSCSEANTMVLSPAAGPLTETADLLRAPAITPPATPAISPETRGAPEARAMPKHNGKATRKTTTEAGPSYLRLSMGLNENLSCIPNQVSRLSDKKVKERKRKVPQT